jgi:predicted transcriptional regulator
MSLEEANLHVGFLSEILSFDSSNSLSLLSTLASSYVLYVFTEREKKIKKTSYKIKLFDSTCGSTASLSR